MPYISQDERSLYENIIRAIDDCPTIKTKGQLEFLIFYLMKTYMSDKEYRYSILHDVCYAAEHCGDEFRRRYLDAREDQAIKQNGDITVL